MLLARTAWHRTSGRLLAMATRQGALTADAPRGAAGGALCGAVSASVALPACRQATQAAADMTMPVPVLAQRAAFPAGHAQHRSGRSMVPGMAFAAAHMHATAISAAPRPHRKTKENVGQHSNASRRQAWDASLGAWARRVRQRCRGRLQPRALMGLAESLQAVPGVENAPQSEVTEAVASVQLLVDGATQCGELRPATFLCELAASIETHTRLHRAATVSDTFIAAI